MAKKAKLIKELEKIDSIVLVDDGYWMGNREFKLASYQGIHSGFAAGEGFGEIYGPWNYEELLLKCEELMNKSVDDDLEISEEKIIALVDFKKELISAKIDHKQPIFFTYDGNFEDGVNLLFANDEEVLTQELYKIMVYDGCLELEPWSDMEIEELEEWAEQLDITVK